MTRFLRLSVLVCLAAVLGGCGALVSPAGASTAGAGAATAALATSSPEPTEVAPIGSPTANDADAIRFRTSFGLQADLAYVRFVAGSPLASNRDFGVPLLPAEVTELNARAANAEAVSSVIQRYADTHADEFAGLYLDQEGGGGAVTTLWTAHLDEHAAAIRAMVRPDARIAFRAATFTYRDLRALQDRIGANWDWMNGSGIAPMGAGVNVIANRLEVDVSSANPRATDIVLAHYGSAAAMMTVISDGTGAVLIPRGVVKGRVVDSLGKPPGDLLAGQLILQWTSDGPGDCGDGDVGFGLARDGTFELPCQAGGHTIVVQIGVPNADWKTLGSGHVKAVGNGSVTVLIKLTQPWPAPNPG